MPKCTFCGNQIAPGTGKMFVYTSGKIDHYCSRKCEVHSLKLKHTPAKTQWTQAYRQGHKKT